MSAPRVVWNTGVSIIVFARLPCQGVENPQRVSSVAMASRESALKKYVLPEDRALVRELFVQKGALYGGYLRDVIAGDEPTDLDVVLSEKGYGIYFIKYLLANNYRLEYNQNDTIVARKPGARNVEMIFVEDDPEEVILGPEASPDFDVNLLVLNADGVLRDWTGERIDLTEIFENIATRRAVSLEPGPNRIEKMMQKGYAILEPTYVPAEDY